MSGNNYLPNTKFGENSSIVDKTLMEYPMTPSEAIAPEAFQHWSEKYSRNTEKENRGLNELLKKPMTYTKPEDSGHSIPKDQPILEYEHFSFDTWNKVVTRDAYWAYEQARLGRLREPVLTVDGLVSVGWRKSGQADHLTKTDLVIWLMRPGFIQITRNFEGTIYRGPCRTMNDYRRLATLMEI